MRLQKKSYFDQMIQTHKNNIKAIWSVPAKYADRNLIIQNKEKIVNESSDVCVSEGPISKEMNLPREENIKLYFTFLENNLMFLGGVLLE